MSKRAHNNSRKKFPHIPLYFEILAEPPLPFVVLTCACTHLVTWDSATSTVRGLFSLKVPEHGNILQMGVATVLSGSWNSFDAFFLFVQIMLSWKEWGVLQIWNTDAGRHTTSRAACCLCTVPERPRSSAVLIHSAQASLSVVKKHGQVSVCFGLFDSTYIISSIYRITTFCGKVTQKKT